MIKSGKPPTLRVLRRSIVAAAATVILVGSLQGQTSLDSLVQQLQNDPGNNSLRDQVIAAALLTKPAPGIPESARRAFIQGNTIAKDAKDADAQKLAIASFQEATKLAPWWGDPYFNLAGIQELLGDYAGARASLQWYIKSKPGDKEERAAQDRIYAIEAREKLAREIASKEQARRNQLKAEADAKAAREAQAANTINAYRGNYQAIRCGVKNAVAAGCSGSEFNGDNWYYAKNYDVRATYRFVFPGDGTIEIIEPVGTNWGNIGTWGVYGIVKKVVGRWSDAEYKIVWSCHYTDDNRTNTAHAGDNPADFTLACDEGPTREQDPNRRYRYINFRRL